MNRSLITLTLVLGGLLTPALQGGVAAARPQVPSSQAPSLQTPAEAEADAPLEFAAALQEEVFWVEGRLAARAIRADFYGALEVEGEWPGAPSGTFRLRDPGQNAAAWSFSGRSGQRLSLRAGPEGALIAEIRCPGQPVRTERWLPAADPEIALEVRPGAEGSLVVRYELSGNPLDLELALVSEDPAFADLDGLVYLESLGRRPLGRHVATWSGRDRSSAAEPVPPGRYRVELRERQFLPAPGADPRQRVVASADYVVPGYQSPKSPQ